MMDQSSVDRDQRTSFFCNDTRFFRLDDYFSSDLLSFDKCTVLRVFFQRYSFRTHGFSIRIHTRFQRFRVWTHKISLVVTTSYFRRRNIINCITHRQASLIGTKHGDSRAMAKCTSMYQFRTSSAVRDDELTGASAYVEARKDSGFATNGHDDEAAK